MFTTFTNDFCRQEQMLQTGERCLIIVPLSPERFSTIGRSQPLPSREERENEEKRFVFALDKLNPQQTANGGPGACEEMVAGAAEHRGAICQQALAASLPRTSAQLQLGRRRRSRQSPGATHKNSSAERHAPLNPTIIESAGPLCVIPLCSLKKNTGRNKRHIFTQ